ncbi:hypothetical protein A8924_5285 [Saccharopolyspora erythraea NRRL 2338]|nr:hypothetical protein [Saccharopolyspora erythraea]EQD85391.1 hypothetical protein N599_15290 [Saccharopolyspora erythraea D]PFG97831.1 hypothetical protein A8924_5285 [Saccharopolyspora erythraea NRRL 2338]QRK87969.1 hypothetical protein JQX30_24895 [Saccharopolyspora erythraea]
MAADNPWFWILMLTGAGLVAAAVVLHVRRMRRSRDMAGVIGDHEILMYLNEALVMDILQYRGDVRALKRRVEQYTRETAEGRGEVKSSLFSIVGGRNREGSTTESFEAEESPITAIRKVVRELEKADAIVYADFHKGEIHPHRTLTDNPAGVAKLSDSRMLLSIDGRFEEYEEGDGSDKDYARLRAPYPSGNAHVRVKITRSGLREQDALPEEKAPFSARVLGKVETWDEQAGVLKMWALAIFR